MNNDSKICTICKLQKPIVAFMRRGDSFRNQCKECHNKRALDYVVNNPEKRKVSKQKSYQKNKSSIAEYSKKYYVSNKDAIIARGMRWEKQNPDKVSAKYNRWRVAHPDKVKEIKNRRRANLAACNTYDISESFLRRLYDSSCVACGSSKNITQDHIIPIARGGTHSEGNLQPLCQSCNSSKKDKLWIEWVHAK